MIMAGNSHGGLRRLVAWTGLILWIQIVLLQLYVHKADEPL